MPSLLEYDLKAKCKEGDFSFLLITSSEGLVLKSSLEEETSEMLGALFSMIFKESQKIFDNYLKDDKIQELYLNGNIEKIVIMPFKINEEGLILVGSIRKNKSVKRKIKRIVKEVYLCLQEA